MSAGSCEEELDARFPALEVVPGNTDAVAIVATEGAVDGDGPPSVGERGDFVVRSSRSIQDCQLSDAFRVFPSRVPDRLHPISKGGLMVFLGVTARLLLNYGHDRSTLAVERV